MELKFKFNLSKRFAEIKVNSFEGLVVTSPVHPPYETIVEPILKSIAMLEVGARHERLFLEQFLSALKEQHPSIVPYVHYAGEQKDKKNGVDFVVGFRQNDEEYKVEFQLKSSNKYVLKHTERYPGKHLFVFHMKMLEDVEALTERFLSFLEQCVRAPKGTGVICTIP